MSHTIYESMKYSKISIEEKVKGIHYNIIKLQISRSVHVAIL